MRLIYVSGYIGLALFVLFWLTFGLRAWFTLGSWCEPHRLYLVLFLDYGMLFFLHLSVFKSPIERLARMLWNNQYKNYSADTLGGQYYERLAALTRHA